MTSTKALLIINLNLNQAQLQIEKQKLNSEYTQVDIEVDERIINSEVNYNEEYDNVTILSLIGLKSIKLIYNYLKKGGKVMIDFKDKENNINVEKEIKLNGFVEVKFDEGTKKYIAEKPNYIKVNKLNLKSKASKKKYLWDKMEENELLNEDELVDDKDFIKPNEDSLCVNLLIKFDYNN
ncbi:hypothetical protein K502DRAFT_145327 [Neoconidiobolus thromboides FSU 785]|nr:hypothetical protein K502DRAFT_145327 [Neoconidiobolus thromboides FSU 785]